MPIEYRTGDLFAYDGCAFAHGVNAAGAMGKGIAVDFKKKYPRMYTEYRAKCKTGTFLIGSLYPYFELRMKRQGNAGYLRLNGKDAEGADVAVAGTGWASYPIWIYNLCIKAHWSLPADDSALWASLRAMVRHMEANNIKAVALPRIGAGLGQLDWETVVKPILEDVASETDCTLIVYSQ